MRDARPLTWPLAAAVAVHAAALVLAQLQLLQPAAGTPDGGARSWTTRIIVPAEPLPAGVPDAPPLAAAQANPAEEAPQRPAAQQGGAPPQPPATTTELRGGDKGVDLDGYLPRRMLTRAPAPLTSVDVPFPRGISGYVDLKVIVALFIDEHGGVKHVRLDTEGVPEEFIEAIRRTFMGARFTPGEVTGSPVRSMVRVQVVFATESEAGTPPPPANPIVLPHLRGS